MTADEFTDLLSKLVGDAEQAGLSSEEVLVRSSWIRKTLPSDI